MGAMGVMILNNFKLLIVITSVVDDASQDVQTWYS